MANILSILIATLAVVGPVAQAGACTPGLHYCGHTLRTYGYPGAQSLSSNNLYECQSDGSLGDLGECLFPCVDGGGGRSDFCYMF
ncbi:hypothetical protein E4U31_004372 [Claviceps sp. LM219 group G6]|nr:hypothetical protein E4U15_006069 [Claviceps sp. LM218 group G6]KAG6099535.1 hypothetical protein E4U31_004372 [Claviceps sp. LM219 group G6]